MTRVKYTVPQFLALPALVLGCGEDAAPGKPSTKEDAGSSAEAAATACSGKPGVAGSSVVTVAGVGAPEGGLREAIVHVPPSYDATRPTMLVLNLHGLLEPNALQETVSHMSDTADERGFIVSYPLGSTGLIGLSWNAGACCGNPNEEVQVIRDLVRAIEADYCVDPKRIFVTGLSNGGMMSHRLACEASDLFAAAAPVAGALVFEPCTPARPVPILAFHGTGDTIVPFNGGVDGLVGALSFPPVSFSVDSWRKINSCPGAPTPNSTPAPADSTPDGGPNAEIFEGSTVVYEKGDTECHAWTGCKDGTEVQLCTVVNGGHGWPGGAPLVGKTTLDIDASSAIIDFFEKHPMP